MKNIQKCIVIQSMFYLIEYVLTNSIVIQFITFKPHKKQTYMNNTKQHKDKQVLAAILNVKKYASTLKKKASNLQQTNNGSAHFMDAASSPSFFDAPQQDCMELASPLLITKSSYNQSFQSMNRQKKEHSMTYLPGSNRLERESRKYSNNYLDEPVSPAKTYAHTGQRTGLSQSYKIQANTFKYGNQIVRKKDSGQLERKSSLMKDKSREGDTSSELNFKKLNQTVTMPMNFTRDNTRQFPIIMTQSCSKIENPKIVEQLLQQIKSLKNQIYDYKNALVFIKEKYLQMQQKCKQKAQCDHQLDVLNAKIIQLEIQKQNLNATIVKQNQKISKFEQTVIQISDKINNHYKQQLAKIAKLQTMNSIFNQLFTSRLPLVLSSSSSNIILPVETSVTNKIKSKQSKTAQSTAYISNNNSSSESQSQSQGYCKPLLNNGKICRNQKDLQIKYEKKDIIKEKQRVSG